MAPLKRSGGTKVPKARSGSISKRWRRGTRATPTPPKTITTGTGIFSRRATTARAVDARRSARSVSKPATLQLREIPREQREGAEGQSIGRSGVVVLAHGMPVGARAILDAVDAALMRAPPVSRYFDGRSAPRSWMFGGS